MLSKRTFITTAASFYLANANLTVHCTPNLDGEVIYGSLAEYQSCG